MTDTTTAEAPAAKPKSRMLVVCENVQAMTPKFAAALPAHIPPEKFVRTVLTTLQLNPDIAMECDAQSIYNECTKAAADGLVIDGREAALVKYNVKKKVDGVDRYVPAAKYMPMVAGLLKKARNSGEISSITARCVYANDKFHVVYGDDEKLTHEPNLDGEPGALRLAYMVARLKDGTLIRHVMTRKQIEKRKAASKGTNGPWQSWEDEMWVKTVLRAGSKFLPASSDRADFGALVERDDDLYALDGETGPTLDLTGEPTEQGAEPQPRRGRGPNKPKPGPAQTILDKATPPAEQQEAARANVTDVEVVDEDTGEITTQPAQEAATAPAAAEPAQQATQAQPAQAAPAATAPVDDGLGMPAGLRRERPAAQTLQPATPPAGNEPPPPADSDVI